MGSTEVVSELEERIAKFVGKPSAIVFGKRVSSILWGNGLTQKKNICRYGVCDK